MKNEGQKLVEHLKLYKDAVVIVGDQIYDKDTTTIKQIDETTKDIFNKKLMSKSPYQFWSYYYENIFNSNNVEKIELEKEIIKLVQLGIVSTAMTLNNSTYISSEDMLHIKGDKYLLKCNRCNEEFDTEIIVPKSSLNKDMKVVKCPICKQGRIRPTVLMYGENYDYYKYQALKESIFIEDELDEDNPIKLNTHTLIFVGVDFEEDVMHELVENFNLIKNRFNTTDVNADKEYKLILITDNDAPSITVYEPEFATTKNITESLTRLVNLIKEK